MDAGEIIRTTMSYTIANASTAQNVFYHQLVGPSISDTLALETIESWVEDSWAAEWETIATNDAVLDSFKAEIVNVDGTIDRVLGELPVNITGIGAGDVLPAAVSLFITAATAIPAVLGRKYVPGFGEGAIENGAFTSAFLSSAVGLATSYVITLIATVFESNLEPGVVSAKASAFVPFMDEAVMTDIPAYQRRRKPNVGI